MTHNNVAVSRSADTTSLGSATLGCVGMDWWEDFFDENYVEVWGAAGSFDNTAEQVDAIEQILGLPPGSQILDVACGFGRIAGPLHERGYDVTGLDYSSTQLGLAQERYPGPQYVEGDMREPPQGPFDAVLNIFSSFGYFEERANDMAALAAWHAVLVPGGPLLMELMHRDRLANLFNPDAEPDEQGPIRENGTTDWVTGVRTATAISGDVSKTFRVRLYTATELVRELRSIGFTTVKVMGGLDPGAVFTPRTRLAIRAVK
ncbi:MAG: methyltransferase domain-containing protein [Actinobacteria bacterium]|nr:methyltransferase domain-containing protein [Actinomycetota bacterium]